MARSIRNLAFVTVASVGLFAALGTTTDAQQTRRGDDQDRSTVHPTDNADYDPQPYYVDGVQYKPYVPAQKPSSSPKVTAHPATPAKTASPSDLKPYVPGTAEDRGRDVTASAPRTEGEAAPSVRVETVPRPESSASSDSDQSRAAKVPAPTTKRPRYGSAVIKTLDKITAETFVFEVPVGKPVRYRGLIYTIKACETTAPEEMQPDVIAYMQVRTAPKFSPLVTDPPKSQEKFSGWIFASSPGVNPFQHAVYDTWVVGCRHPIT